MSSQKMEVDQETAPLKVPRNNNNNASTKFAKRFLRNRNNKSASPPIYVWIIGVAALYGLIQLYHNKKSDESLSKNMVKSIPFVGTTTSNTESPNNDDWPIAKTNEFLNSYRGSPYEEIWINSKLPNWAKKQPKLRSIEKEILPNERICYVHVGKAGGSSVGCSLGFSLHCTNSSGVMDGLLPRRTTRLFHADTYDCHDDSAFFLFVVRDPVKRIQSDFLYERPPNEWVLKKKFPEYYTKRKEYYLDCPFRTMEDVVRYGLLKNSTVKEECKMRAFTALWGTRHYMCHHYFNYQFHLEGLPKGARILVIRNEHLVKDWNGVEHFIGGEKEIIPANTTLDRQNENKHDDADADRHLSPASQRIICAQLCNEIVNYKKILRRALNLNPSDVRETIEELRLQCPEMADVEEGDCVLDMPDIREKLVNTRGYRYVVMQGSYEYNAEQLETKNHYEKVEAGPNIKDESDAAVAEDLEDDDDYKLPYSGT